MRPGNWVFASALALIGIALAAPAAAQNDSVVVQAAKQKASEKKSGHVYTDEDVRTSSSAAALDQGNDAAGSSNEDANTDSSGDKTEMKAGEKKTDGKSADVRPADDQKLKDLEAKLADAKKGEQELQRKLAALQQKADSTQDEFRKKMYQDMITNQQVTLDEFRSDQESLAAQIEKEKDKNKDQASDQENKTNQQ